MLHELRHLHHLAQVHYLLTTLAGLVLLFLTGGVAVKVRRG